MKGHRPYFVHFCATKEDREADFVHFCATVKGREPRFVHVCGTKGVREGETGFKSGAPGRGDDNGRRARYVPPMTAPSTLIVGRYRAFADEVRLPLRPLTLLYGRNNAGKSALVRALGILGASVDERASSAISFPKGMREVPLEELAWKGDAGDYSMTVGLCWDDGPLREARFTVDVAADPLRPFYVREVVLRDDADAESLMMRRPDGRVAWALGGDLAFPAIAFTGLVPLASDSPLLVELATKMAALRGRVRWLDGVRSRPPGDFLQPQPNLEHEGSGLDAYARLLGHPELVRDVAKFYARLDPPRELTVNEPLKGKWRIGLKPGSGSKFSIDLADNGEGMVQVLPVLVAAALAGEQAKDGGGSILAVEEPESHLHPDAQRVLADYLCDLAAAENPPTLVLETHSRVFLLAVQLAVAEGRLLAEHVGLAWVDQDAEGRSQVTPVNLAADGHLTDGWPAAALAEDLRLAADVARIALQRRRS